MPCQDAAIFVKARTESFLDTELEVQVKKLRNGWKEGLKVHGRGKCQGFVSTGWSWDGPGRCHLGKSELVQSLAPLSSAHLVCKELRVCFRARFRIRSCNSFVYGMEPNVKRALGQGLKKTGPARLYGRISLGSAIAALSLACFLMQMLL